MSRTIAMSRFAPAALTQSQAALGAAASTLTERTRTPRSVGQPLSGRRLGAIAM